MTGRPIVVWASGEIPREIDDGNLHCLWDRCSEGECRRSLLNHVERNGDRFRDRYLQWVEGLADIECHGSSLVDQLVLNNGLSFWWMTRAAERSPWRSNAVATVLRLMALEELVREELPPVVLLVGADRSVEKAIKGLCMDVGARFERKRSWHLRLRDLKPRPHTLQAIVLFGKLIGQRWKFRRLPRPSWRSGDDSVFFCSYFENLTHDVTEAGRFGSTFWGDVPEILDESARGNNWVHLYVGAHSAPDVDESIDLVRRFNREPSRNDAHTFPEAYLTKGLLVRVLRQWLSLLVLSIRIRPFTGDVILPADSPWLRAVMAKDFAVSLRGLEALWHLLLVELFDKIAAEMPPQASGYYLCENISWERALVHAWRRHGHGRLLGVAHATIPYWDLRYHQNWKTWGRRLAQGVPEPDHLIVNGPMAFQSLRGAEAPNGFVLRCEAVRYGHLDRRPVHRRSQSEDRCRLLVLGEWNGLGTSFVLSLLASALPMANRLIDVAVKPHPSQLPNDAELATVGGRLVDGRVEDLLGDCDRVLVSNSTSVALDAYVFGWPMAVTLSPEELNFSDLRSCSDVLFVSTPEELATFLSMESPSSRPRLPSQFFCFDTGLAGWRKTLAES